MLLDIDNLITFFISLTSSKLIFQVIDNDSGARMRPMPGMISFAASGPIVLISAFSFCLMLSGILFLGHLL